MGQNVIENVFAKDVFNDSVMRERLPKPIYKKLKKIIAEGQELDMEAELAKLRQEPEAVKFFDPDKQLVFPEGDYWRSTAVDKFDFVLKVEQLEDDIFESHRIDV